MSKSLEERIERLEAIEEIRCLKARYWRACDQKDVEKVRACFAPGEIHVDYDGTGRHSSRDDFYELFEKFSLREQIVEHHHGASPEIYVLDALTAGGRWSLQYRLMDTKKNTLFVIGGYYDDRYERIDGTWLIRRSQFRTVSTSGYGWAKGNWKLLHAGRSVTSGPSVEE